MTFEKDFFTFTGTSAHQADMESARCRRHFFYHSLSHYIMAHPYLFRNNLFESKEKIQKLPSGNLTWQFVGAHDIMTLFKTCSGRMAILP